MMGSKFHYKDGWYFERLEDGSVKITHPATGYRNVREGIEIDPASWASIVASVTPVGDNAETYSMATKLHAHSSPLREVQPEPNFAIQG